MEELSSFFFLFSFFFPFVCIAIRSVFVEKSSLEVAVDAL